MKEKLSVEKSDIRLVNTYVCLSYASKPDVFLSTAWLKKYSTSEVKNNFPNTRRRHYCH